MGCDIHTIVEIKRSDNWERIPDLPKQFDDRNYSVFSFLANVRNSFDIDGFEPRGLPNDISGLCFDKDDEDDFYHIDFRPENTDYHSHSFLTLQELIDKDKSDLNTVKCKVLKCVYDKFIELGGVVPNGMTISERVPDNFGIIDMVRESIEPTVIVKWPNGSRGTHPIIDGIQELQKIADKYNVDPENIRIVFAFDN